MLEIERIRCCIWFWQWKRGAEFYSSTTKNYVVFYRKMQTRYHLKGFCERNLILTRVVRFSLLKGVLLPSEFYESFCLFVLHKVFGVMPFE